MITHGIQGGQKLGKCTLCDMMIVNNEQKFWCREAKIISQKWFCGDCLLSLKPTIDEIHQTFEWMENIQFKFGGSLNVDPETGRLRKD